MEPVDTTSTPIEWASPIVCIPKQNGKMRICVDFKATINQYVFVDPHPLPRFEDKRPSWGAVSNSRRLT